MATKKSRTRSARSSARQPGKVRAGTPLAKNVPGEKSAKPPGVRKRSKVAAAAATTPETSERSDQKRSALDAAALVLADSAEPMNCGDLIKVMAAKGLWTSPAGKTPAATLYAAILKEIVTKDKASRFRKVARGQFARS